MSTKTQPNTPLLHPFIRFIQHMQTLPVQQALNALQNHYALNPNLLLLCCWHAQHYPKRLTQTRIKHFIGTIQAWHDRIFIPLQEIENLQQKSRHPKLQSWGQFLKDTQHKTGEIEQRLLADTLPDLPPLARTPSQQLTDACHNLNTYLNLLQMRFDRHDREALHGLLHAAFPELEPTQIEETCNKICFKNRRAQALNYVQLPLKLT